MWKNITCLPGRGDDILIKETQEKMLDKEKWKDTYKVTSHLLFIQLLFFADAKMRWDSTA